MKIHPTVGGDILKRLTFLYPVARHCPYHHEKWDGSGYPKGLRAKGIPLVARIISVDRLLDATRVRSSVSQGNEARGLTRPSAKDVGLVV
jgi:HD-GYP domain-containing protein (c-di-GMP phosphodiesterase class II)